MVPALLLKALTNNRSLLGVEEIMQRKHEACLHTQGVIVPLDSFQQRHSLVPLNSYRYYLQANNIKITRRVDMTSLHNYNGCDDTEPAFAHGAESLSVDFFPR